MEIFATFYKLFRKIYVRSYVLPQIIVYLVTSGKYQNRYENIIAPFTVCNIHGGRYAYQLLFLSSRKWFSVLKIVSKVPLQIMDGCMYTQTLRMSVVLTKCRLARNAEARNQHYCLVHSSTTQDKHFKLGLVLESSASRLQLYSYPRRGVRFHEKVNVCWLYRVQLETSSWKRRMPVRVLKVR